MLEMIVICWIKITDYLKYIRFDFDKMSRQYLSQMLLYNQNFVQVLLKSTDSIAIYIPTTFHYSPDNTMLLVSTKFVLPCCCLSELLNFSSAFFSSLLISSWVLCIIILYMSLNDTIITANNVWVD